MIKCKNEKNGKCNIGLRNACYVCDYLIPVEAKEINVNTECQEVKPLGEESKYKRMIQEGNAWRRI